jgi:UPF0716 protein FxsA
VPLLAGAVALLVLEVVVVVLVASWIGIGWTLLILVAGGVLGALLVRREGMRAWRSFRAEVTEGRPPGRSALDGVLVLLGGLLVVFPGFVSDVLALLCLLPPTRRLLGRGLAAWALTRGRATVVRVRSTRGPVGGATAAPPRPPRGPGRVIEGEPVPDGERPGRPEQ